jgi:hypothetical protein
MSRPPLTIRGAWLALTAALAIHVADEAANDFLAVYNPAVTRIREAVPLLPLPRFTFAVWLAGLVVAVLVLAALGWRAARGGRWVVPLGSAFAVLMAANGAVHLTVSVAQGRLMPGTYSAPLLLGAAIVLLWTIRAQRVSDRQMPQR